MRQVHQNFQTFEDDFVGGFALDISHETDATGVMFVCGIVETLRGWKLAHCIDWVHVFSSVVREGIEFIVYPLPAIFVKSKLQGSQYRFYLC
jgi:hypothetical protein